MLSKISWPNLQLEIFYSFHLGFKFCPWTQIILEMIYPSWVVEFYYHLWALSSHVWFPKKIHFGFNFVHEHKCFLRWFTQVELLSFIISPLSFVFFTCGFSYFSPWVWFFPWTQTFLEMIYPSWVVEFYYITFEFFVFTCGPTMGQKEWHRSPTLPPLPNFWTHLEHAI